MRIKSMEQNSDNGFLLTMEDGRSFSIVKNPDPNDSGNESMTDQDRLLMSHVKVRFNLVLLDQLQKTYEEKEQATLEMLRGRYGDSPDFRLTCSSCESRHVCPSAADPYNTDGDCLEMK